MNWDNIYTDVWWTIAISGSVFFIFIYFQLKYFSETFGYIKLYHNFFSTVNDYKTEDKDVEGVSVPQLSKVGKDGCDLNDIISEINYYIEKTRGTTDFSIIQNKVERYITMRYDQAMAKLSFPTNIGLMGTFCGVFLGIFMFVVGFDGSDSLRDASIRNLLIGVLISMSTSFVGLLLTTTNSGRIGEAQKEVESDKNEFYDFIQTELMPTLDVSLVSAISKLHETVNTFEPAFSNVIDRFQNTFDRCTRAFGDNFEKNVNTVSDAVRVMGANMDKINENVELQKSVLATLKSEEITKGLEQYVDAANHFVGITQSLNKFEEARRMMLAAAQEAINLQNAYSESLTVPREVALRVNQILDRIKNFEANIERLGDKLNEREILGNDVVNAISEQVNSIVKKNKIAENYLQKADGELEDLFNEQTKVIESLNNRYTTAIRGHIEGFEDLMDQLSEDIQSRHKQFLALMEDNLSIEMIHKDFANLSKLDQLSVIREDLETIFAYLESTNNILGTIEFQQRAQDKSNSKKDAPVPYVNNEETRRLRSDNLQLKNDINRLSRQIEILEQELRHKPETPRPAPEPIPVYHHPVMEPELRVESQQEGQDEKQDDNDSQTVVAAETKKSRFNWWPFNKKE